MDQKQCKRNLETVQVAFDVPETFFKLLNSILLDSGRGKKKLLNILFIYIQ